MLTIERILHPTDFSKYSAVAARYACAMVDKFGAELHVLHTLEFHPSATPVFGGGLALTSQIRESRAAAEKEMQQVLDPDWAESHRVVQAINEGIACFEIMRYAKENDIDLIVLGTHGRSGFAHVMMGSVAERVVRSAKCPVLTVHSDDHVFVAP